MHASLSDPLVRYSESQRLTIAREDHIRNLFAEREPCPEINDPHVLLTDVFANRNLLYYQDEDPDEVSPVEFTRVNLIDRESSTDRTCAETSAQDLGVSTMLLGSQAHPVARAAAAIRARPVPHSRGLRTQRVHRGGVPTTLEALQLWHVRGSRLVQCLYCWRRDARYVAAAQLACGFASWC